MDTPSEAKKDTEGEIARELLGALRYRRGGAEKRKSGAVDCSPHGGREGAIDQEVAEGLRDLPLQQTTAEIAVSMGCTTTVADVVCIVEHPEQGVPSCHSHVRTVQKTSEQ